MGLGGLGGAFGNGERNLAFPDQMALPHQVQAWTAQLQVINVETGQGKWHPLRAAKFQAIRASGALGSLAGAWTETQQRGRAC